MQKDLESALNTKLDFTASFSFEKRHPSAPNPALSVQQIGTIGLPLNQHDADAIKSIAEQAPFGKGERTVVDKTVRDTWEIDGSLVRVPFMCRGDPKPILAGSAGVISKPQLGYLHA